ncbi:hypothetical protein AX16_008425 [Volvariella volvacea WC 439]|nr:hypothetical protein AX16_008425 [Volvariella volvacea WC 439]
MDIDDTLMQVVYSTVNFGNAQDDHLRELSDACSPAPFGLDGKNVYDETYRKARKMNPEDFTINFSPDRHGIKSLVNDALVKMDAPIRVELYKLNVYGELFDPGVHLYGTLTPIVSDKGSFFKAHKDTPRGPDMFGSLVVILPTQHTGGQLLLRHEDQQWTIDPVEQLREAGPTSGSADSSSNTINVAYVAFYGDIEHEVLPIESGYRVTLTYNLYYDKTKEIDTNAATLVTRGPPNLGTFKDILSTLIAEESVLPHGGYLGYYLKFQYPVEYGWKSEDLQKIKTWLKGTDAIIADACRELSLPTILRVALYQQYDDDDEVKLLSGTPDLLKYQNEGQNYPARMFREYGSETVTTLSNRRHWGSEDSEDGDNSSSDLPKGPHQIMWLGRKGNIPPAYRTYTGRYGNEATVLCHYGDLVLIIRVGPPARRKGAE